ncbi:hypothetical protein ASV31_00235 [Enterobacter hormaechei subsp. hoffmannii]|nr:hypothetical protein ASV31_00235 [Enterobacter hormaechei subsp. hoffmannii]KTJ78402.1 hypothetical protein ASU76_19000 [Enterobacter hormaechei subsp. hoffmannii]KTK01939.1 hypothetical protein ASU71_20385 [Enterobacter hormaechei subsp. hoffmannii]KTK18016.1 hypothetical protein ASU67_20985 [Enterobacter hormaechei subsp. hoffmannii]KVI91118.1 hypothetical protein AWS42_02415 [Enterobacter hormaechei subsp. hoffmannii]
MQIRGAQKFFLCDFPFSIRQKKRCSQNFLLVKNNAQQEIPNKRHPLIQRYM